VSSNAPDQDERELAQQIRHSDSSENVVSTTLRTDERVIARITDGIYRQPASALRELLSNSYDADATRVVIKTDAPRFERIVVEDNGRGMTPEVLAHLLLHIGGSAKRSEKGQSLEITSSSDPFRSPGGRPLIGKIGIGLFSVSQLTHSFQIITKVKDDNHRTVATVSLKQYTDDQVITDDEPSGDYESGKVNVWRENATDISSQGTTIVLTNIRPQARDTLRSREIWSAIEQAEAAPIGDERPPIEPPNFHIGRVDPTSGELLKKTYGKYDSLPWEGKDSPDAAFGKLVQSVWDEVENYNPNPQLERIFDYYLRMIWQISLAVPLPYVEGHLFDLRASADAKVFSISNQPKGAASSLDVRDSRPLRTYLGLTDQPTSGGQFDVFFDNLKLSRPIKFADLPTTSHALREPLIFLGKCSETFPKLSRELSGGPLQFEAYLFWAPKIAPTEHQGSLIRIHGASGTLFDSTFMRYQVSEQTRLRQITCEIFVHQGLESALNIDRESFNNAHPHSVYITKWLHSALRQLATVQKRLAGEVRTHVRSETQEKAVSEIQQIADRVWAEENDDPASSPPPVELTESDRKTSSSPADAYVFPRSVIVAEQSKPKTQKTRSHYAILERKVMAIAQLLASFGLLDVLSRKKQERLLRAIYEILDAPNE
jgi:hypothetical protein